MSGPRFGAPKALITDNGSVFRAKQLLAICEALEIEKEYIHPRQSWENLVETHLYVIWNLENSQITCIMWTTSAFLLKSFRRTAGVFHIINAQRKLADWHFDRA